MIPPQLTPMETALKKHIGAYYTDRQVADFLVNWAVRSHLDKVLDPSYGDGVFVRSAQQRLSALGASDFSVIFGIDIQPRPPHMPEDIVNLFESNFFKVRPQDIPAVDAVVGNPPFIRYQTFNGDGRSLALKSAAAAGVNLTSLASSWAPFLVHSIQFLRPGGRLAMVVPAEINHAAYATPVLAHLIRSFSVLRFVLFQDRIFSDLSQDTYLLLADQYGAGCRSLTLHVVQGATSLAGTSLEGGVQADPASLATGQHRLLEYLLPSETRSLYGHLAESPIVRRFGALGDVGIGYVTGSNDYFHLSAQEVVKYRIPHRFLRPAVRSSRQLKGLLFTSEDWQALEAAGDKVWLLAVPKYLKNLPKPLRIYLAKGRRTRVDQGYKSRVRPTWYSVPHVHVGDAFLTYMSGHWPRVVSNEARAVATNALHIVQLKEPLFVDEKQLAGSWYTTFTMISCEIKGHALGGGMLKLEPSEAERVDVFLPEPPLSENELAELDSLLRLYGVEAALGYTDQKVLVERLGLSERDCQLLRDGLILLRDWRMR